MAAHRAGNEAAGEVQRVSEVAAVVAVGAKRACHRPCFVTAMHRRSAEEGVQTSNLILMKTNLILALLTLVTAAVLASCSAGGSANVRGSGIGSASASVSGSGSISDDRR